MQPKVNQLSIVMPCFNEQEAIPIVLPRIIDSLQALQKQKRIDSFELLVIDDQSTDHSAKLLEAYSSVRVIRTEGKRGYGSALKSGFSKAAGDWIGFLDVDNSYRPEDLGRFIEEVEKGSSDFVMGSRDYSEAGMSPIRGFGNYFYVMLAQWIYKSPLSDVCSGYRLFHRKYLGEILEIREDGLDFSIQFTLRMLTNRIVITQIPIQYDPRLGDSKLSVVKDGLSFLKVLLTHRARRTRAYKHS